MVGLGVEDAVVRSPSVRPSLGTTLFHSKPKLGGSLANSDLLKMAEKFWVSGRLLAAIGMLSNLLQHRFRSAMGMATRVLHAPAHPEAGRRD
jgi:hypothetical protein